MIDPADPRSGVIRDFHRLYYDGLGGAPPQKRISFLGVETVKCPLDLWIYQEILHRTRPEVIVECGVFRGGTTLYLASLCDLLGIGEVVACDLTLGQVHPRSRAHPRVSLLEGSSTDPTIHGEIARRCRGRRTMAILDSDHSEAHVAGELRLYGPLVSPGCYLICEDTNVNGHPVYPGFGPGPYEAVRRFLAEEPGWRVDGDCDKLLLSFNPSGYLVREAPGIAGGPSRLAGRSTSVILACAGGPGSTRECVGALMRHTRRPWELIAVDDGSPGTAAYLGEVRDTAAIRVEVIAAAGERGFAAACNLGLKAARGDYAVLLSGEVSVTDGWLDQLVGLAESGPAIGMVGPMSDSAPPPQLAEGVPQGDAEEMGRFASRWRSDRRGQWQGVGRLWCGCVLLKRCVLDAVGGLDERLGAGPCGDEDLGVRARRAGFTLAVARDLLVHRTGVPAGGAGPATAGG